MADSTAQVKITNTITGENGRLIPSVLSIKASALLGYVLSIKNECNRTYTPNRSKEFDYLPLLSVWDLADTGEEYLFKQDELPKETVLNSKNIPILIILPEEYTKDMGINDFDVLDEETRGRIHNHIKECKGNQSKLDSEPLKSNKNE